MQTEYIEQVAKTPEKTHPYIGIVIDTERNDGVLVVLFVNKEKGTALKDTLYSLYEVGEMRSDWTETQFSRANGKITLSND